MTWKVESIARIIQSDNAPSILLVGFNVANRVLRIELEYINEQRYCCNESGCHYGFTISGNERSDKERDEVMAMLSSEIGYSVNSIVMIFRIARGSITNYPYIVASRDTRYAITVRR
jgi:hypothetical protein